MKHTTEEVGVVAEPPPPTPATLFTKRNVVTHKLCPCPQAVGIPSYIYGRFDPHRYCVNCWTVKHSCPGRVQEILFAAEMEKKPLCLLLFFSWETYEDTWSKRHYVIRMQIDPMFRASQHCLFLLLFTGGFCVFNISCRHHCCCYRPQEQALCAHLNHFRWQVWGHPVSPTIAKYHWVHASLICKGKVWIRGVGQIKWNEGAFHIRGLCGNRATTKWGGQSWTPWWSVSRTLGGRSGHRKKMRF